MRAGLCITPAGCLSKVSDAFWGSLAEAVAGAAGQMVTNLFGWWTKTPSVDLDAAYVHAGQAFVTTWVAIPLAILSIFAAVAWGVLGGGVRWFADITRGFLIFGIAAASSIFIASALQEWSGDLSKGLLGAVPTEDVGRRYIATLILPNQASQLLSAFWGCAMFLAAAVQYLQMLFRDGAVVVLTAVIPVSAAGQFNRSSMMWLPKVAGWLLAFIFFKPAAALIYFIGLNLLGEGQDLQALATAVCIMISAIVALPAMLTLVSFAVTAPQIGGGAFGAATTATGLGASLAQTAAVRGAGSAGAPQGAGSALPQGTGGAAQAASGGAAVQVAQGAQAGVTNTVTPAGKGTP